MYNTLNIYYTMYNIHTKSNIKQATHTNKVLIGSAEVVV